MQLTETKRSDSFLIAEISAFRKPEAHFRTHRTAAISRAAVHSSRAGSSSSLLAARHSLALSLPAEGGEVEGPLATTFLIGTAKSNQFCVSCTKQSVALTSNRDRFRDSRIRAGRSIHHTYGKLEVCVNPTKQTFGLISNR